MTESAGDIRRTEQGHVIDAALLRGSLRAALEHDVACDEVHELLFEHVVERRYHPSVVAESLRPILIDLIAAAQVADWQIIANDLIDDARLALGPLDEGSS